MIHSVLSVMSGSAGRKWLLIGWIWPLLSAFAMPLSAQITSHNVLIIHTYRSDAMPYGAISAAFKTALVRDFGALVNIHEISLDSDRFPDPKMQSALAEFLKKRFAERPLDLILPIGAPAGQFVAQYRESTFPGAPVIYLSVDSRLLNPESFRKNATVFSQRISPASWIEDILQLAPDTANIVVVTGVSPLERFWTGILRRELQVFGNRVKFSFFSGMSLDRMEKEVSALPPHSFILFGLLIEDGVGITYGGYEPLQRIHAAANAPIYGIFQSEIGQGIIGGRLYQDQILSIQAAAAAARILRGKPVASIPGNILQTSSAVYDWRELKRWGISETRLPPGSAILHREPTLWQRYRWYIVAFSLVTFLEALLIVGLLTSLAKRRRMEKELRQSEQKYRRLYESMMDAFVSVDMSGRIREFNPAYQKMLGYAEEELLRLTYPEITPEKWHESEAQIIREQVLQRGYSGVYEKEYRRKDGTVIPIELRTLLIKDDAGRPNGMWAIVRDITERKQAEAALQQRNRYIETILEESPIGFAVHTVDDGVARFVSARFEEIYCVPRGAIDSHYTFFDKVWPHDPDLREEIRRRVVADMTSGDASRMHWENVPVQSAAGETRYINAMNIPVLEQNLMVSTVQDVTEQVRAREALSESEGLLHLAAEAAQFGAYSYYFSGGRVFCTPENLALHGLPPGASFKLDENLVPEDLYPEDKANFLAHMMVSKDPRGSGMLDVEYRILRTDGQVRWLRTRGRTNFSADGIPHSQYGIVQDITERKRADDALRVSEDRLRQVTELVSDFVWEVDENGLYKYTSASVEKILGYTPDELIGKKHFYDLFAPDLREQLKEAAFQTFAQRQSFQAFPNINISKSGRTVHLETSGMPILDESNRLLGYRGADIDVTEKLRAETESQLLRRELALFSRVATINELTASLAHELNQPLAAILNNAQAALRFIEKGSPDLNELKEIFKDIVVDDKRAAEVIRSLRSMLKKGEAEHQNLLLNDLTADVASIVRNDAMMRNVVLALDLDSPVPPVKGDRVQLQQVILNLIFNAFESMESTDLPATLRIRTRTLDGEAILDIADSGPGIANDKLDSIFEPFVTTKNEGLGLGLALSRSIVVAHKGRLWAENNPDGGATFHMALPAIKS
jgi:PAS domain S-box-containing protein